MTIVVTTPTGRVGSRVAQLLVQTHAVLGESSDRLHLRRGHFRLFARH